MKRVHAHSKSGTSKAGEMYGMKKTNKVATMSAGKKKGKRGY